MTEHEKYSRIAHWIQRNALGYKPLYKLEEEEIIEGILFYQPKKDEPIEDQFVLQDLLYRDKDDVMTLEDLESDQGYIRVECLPQDPENADEEKDWVKTGVALFNNIKFRHRSGWKEVNESEKSTWQQTNVDNEINYYLEATDDHDFFEQTNRVIRDFKLLRAVINISNNDTKDFIATLTWKDLRDDNVYQTGWVWRDG